VASVTQGVDPPSLRYGGSRPWAGMNDAVGVGIRQLWNGKRPVRLGSSGRFWSLAQHKPNELVFMGDS
jgi:hypothetical protein